MNKKGFLLIDSLINVLIVSLMCLLCFGEFKAIDAYTNGYDTYLLESNEQYDFIFNSLKECEKCIIEEESSTPELY